MEHEAWVKKGKTDVIAMIEPNWDYFIHAPLSHGVLRYQTRTERALAARVQAAEMNWNEYQTAELYNHWNNAKNDLKTYREGLNQRKN